MVFDGILISFIVGFLRKGNLKGIATLNLKWGWIFPVLLLIQFTVYLLQNKYEVLGNASGVIFMLVYVAGLTFLWINRNYRGMSLILVGVFLNFIVMAVNGGRMPVSAEAAAILDPYYLQTLKDGLYAKHTLLVESTKLGFLGDIIPLSNPYPRTQVISIGDVIMNIGVFYFIQYLMVDLKNKETDESITLLKGVNS
ncbi:DUF5317 domain-containing protein [Bacillus timonensis]|nr:DUF5317 domain-containing protein [Bacillus timonensis]